jgi:hypothetical protein
MTVFNKDDFSISIYAEDGETIRYCRCFHNDDAVKKFHFHLHLCAIYAEDGEIIQRHNHCEQ